MRQPHCFRKRKRFSNEWCNPLLELRIERALRIVRLGKEYLKYSKRCALYKFFIAGSAELLLHVPAEIMPCIDIALIDADTWNLEVLADLHLCTRTGTCVVYDKVPEGAIFIAAPERKEAAEARPEIMNLAAAVRPQEGAGDIVASHQQVWKDQSFLNVQRNAHIEKRIEILAQMFFKLVQVIWIEVYCVIHTPAALSAALTGAAGDPSEVAGCEQFGHIGVEFLSEDNRSGKLCGVSCRCRWDRAGEPLGSKSR